MLIGFNREAEQDWSKAEGEFPEVSMIDNAEFNRIKWILFNVKLLRNCSLIVNLPKEPILMAFSRLSSLITFLSGVILEDLERVWGNSSLAN